MTISRRLHRFWLHFHRFWHVIDLNGARRAGNWPLVTDCRLRITALDAELDRLGVP